MIRLAVAVALLTGALALTGCATDTREACEARGGSWEKATILVPQIVGKTTILIPHVVDVCEEG